MIQIVWLALVVIGLAATLTFVAMYAVSAPRTWHRSLAGRTLMANAAVISGLLALVLANALFSLPIWLWLGGMASFDLVLWSQVLLLWRANRMKV